jgi:hypothetical protein
MGQNLIIESTAVAVIVWMNDQTRYGGNIIPAINWIISRVSSGGSYGSTQATVLSLKAITLYMKNFTEINGDGKFVLRLNGQKVQSIKFNSTMRESIQFDFEAIKKDYPNLLVKGSNLLANLSLEDFVPNKGETKDFKINYAFSFNYYDTTPQSKANPALGFKVVQTFDDRFLGLDRSQGQVFSYKLVLTNLKKPVGPITMQRGVDATIIKPGGGGGLGMVLAILRIPACLQIDFNFLEGLKRNKIVDYYEV